VIFILVGVAFFTLIERKVLGYIHFRLGPNKVSFLGILQPIRDAIKLFRRESMKFEKLNYFFLLFFSTIRSFFNYFNSFDFSFLGIIFYLHV